MIEIKQKVVPSKEEGNITWSEDLVIELHEKHLTVRCHYIYEGFVNGDEAQGVEVRVKEYETNILKASIYSCEWAWDDKDECYCFQVVCDNSSMAYNSANKKQAIEQCSKILQWLLS